MSKETAIKIFESRQVRTVWNEEEEEWYFSIVDVVEALTDSVNPTDYLAFPIFVTTNRKCE